VQSTGASPVTSPVLTQRRLFLSRPTVPFVHSDRHSNTCGLVVGNFQSSSQVQHFGCHRQMSVGNVCHSEGTVVGDVMGLSHKNIVSPIMKIETGGNFARVPNHADHIGLTQNETPNSRSPRRSQVTRTAQICQGASVEKDHISLVEEIHEAIKQLKVQHEACIAQVSASVEAKFCSVEQRLLEIAESNAKLTDMLNAIGATREENLKMMAAVESRLSAIETCIGGTTLAEIHKLIDQHNVKHKVETPAAHRVAQQEDMNNLKDALACQPAAIQGNFDAQNVTSTAEIDHLHSVLKRMKAGLFEDRFNHTQPHPEPLSISSIALPEHDGAACGVALRSAARALAEAVDPSGPAEIKVGSFEPAATAAQEYQSAVLSQEDADVDLGHEPGSILHASSSQTHGELAPPDHDLMTSTCHPIPE